MNEASGEISFTTRGGVEVRRAAERRRRRRRGHRRLPRGARYATRRGVLLELRISRPLHALGRRLHRPALEPHGARPRGRDRGPQRARCRPVAGHRRGDGRRRIGSRVSREATERSRSPCASPRRASPRRSASVSRPPFRRCGPSSRCSAMANARILGSTAPSAMISPSNSTRSASASRAPTGSATSCSICPTRSSSSTITPPRRRAFLTNSRSRAARPSGLRAVARPSPSASRELLRPLAIMRLANMPASCARRSTRFKRGDLFEVVPGQTFFERCAAHAIRDLGRARAHQSRALRLHDQSRR